MDAMSTQYTIQYWSTTILIAFAQPFFEPLDFFETIIRCCSNALLSKSTTSARRASGASTSTSGTASGPAPAPPDRHEFRS